MKKVVKGMEQETKKKRISISLTLIVTFLIGLIGSPLFYNWYSRPVVVIDIKEFELPKVYTETIQKQLSKIPRISIIEITNVGKSAGDTLSLDFKTNNNTTLQGVSVETRSDVLKYTTEEAKDGSSIVSVDMEYIRPNENVIIKALTNIKANFFIKQKLMTKGDILTSKSYEKTKGIIQWIAIGLFYIVFMLIFDFIVGVVKRHKRHIRENRT